MPYIKGRSRFKKAIGDISGQIEGPGDLNYVISKLAKKYMQIREPTSYALLNEIIGVFEAAKAEFYRRIVVPYEEVKLNENGDI